MEKQNNMDICDLDLSKWSIYHNDIFSGLFDESINPKTMNTSWAKEWSIKELCKVHNFVPDYP